MRGSRHPPQRRARQRAPTDAGFPLPPAVKPLGAARASPGASVAGRAPPAQFPQRPPRRGVPGGTAHAQPCFEPANRRAPPRVPEAGRTAAPGATRTRGGRPRRKVASFTAANGSRWRAQAPPDGWRARRVCARPGKGAAPLGCEVTSSCLRCRQVGEIEHCCRSRRRALLCYLHPPRVGWGAMRNQSNNGGRAASAFLQSSCSASCVTGLGSGYQRFRCCARGERIASSYLHCSLLSFSSLSPQHRTHTISAQPPARIHGPAPKQPYWPKKAGPTRNCIEYTVIPTHP